MSFLYVFIYLCLLLYFNRYLEEPSKDLIRENFWPSEIEHRPYIKTVEGLYISFVYLHFLCIFRSEAFLCS